IKKCQDANIRPSVRGFAEHIGTDENSVWGWATKHKKDKDGKTTDELARPNFFSAIQKLKKFDDEKRKEDRPIEEKLNQKQEMFCYYYAKSREHFGNGAVSYAAAYGLDLEDKKVYEVAKVSASRLLTNVNVIQRI